MEKQQTDEVKSASSAPSARQGCGLIVGGAALAFFGCLGAIAAGSNGFMVFVTGSAFVAGLVIMITALIKKFTKTR